MKYLLVVLILTITAASAQTTSTYCSTYGGQTTCTSYTNNNQGRQDFASGFQQSGGSTAAGQALGNALGNAIERHREHKWEKKYCKSNPDGLVRLRSGQIVSCHDVK